MLLGNTKKQFGLVSQFFHLSVAILMIGLLILGTLMVELPEDAHDEVEAKFWWFSFHKTVGIIAFLIAIARILWTVSQPHPRPLPTHNKREILAARTVHYLLYSVMIVMPVSGWLHHAALEGYAPIWLPYIEDISVVPKDEMFAEVFSHLHALSAILLMMILFLHVAGALKHAFIDADGTLKRMFSSKQVFPGEADLKPDLLDYRPVVITGFVISGLLVMALLFAVNTDSNRQIVASEGLEAKQRGQWVVDHDKSNLSINVTQSGRLTTGGFSRWDALINLDPDTLEDASVQVTISIDSLELGSVSKSAKSSGFLNAEMFPTATYESRKITSAEADKYFMEGVLTVAGQTHPVDIEFTLKIDGNNAHAVGKTVLSRLDFGVGAQGYPDEKSVGFDVGVTFEIWASR